MHYYQFNIGDYAKSTKHLTLLEDLAYRRLLDIYYDTEKPLNTNVKQLARIAGMSAHTDEITNVLSDFFTETEEGFTQKKAACEIDLYQAKAVVARVNGKKGGRPAKTQTEPKITQPVNSANPAETGLKPNYKPLTINQEPLTINQELSVKEKDLPTIVEEHVFKLPTNKTDVFYLVKIEEINNYNFTYLAVDIEQQYRQILSWLNANPKNRKTLGGMPKFINAWLSKSQNNAARVNTPQQRPVSTTEHF
jgi:uncharacterized protein YdaU (DUF1376 family)